MKPNVNNGVTRLLILIACLLHAGQSFGQATTTEPAKAVRAEVTSLKFNSPLMGREMPYRLILPPDYKAKPEQRYATVYLLHGLGGNYQNWNALTRLAEYALKHSFIIVIAEGGNGWYTDSLTVPNDKYESYIVKDLIPEIDKTYRTIPDRNNRIIAGLSHGVLVVEAAPQSGSLITARQASEQGKEVFAIPGSIHSPQSRGCHALIRQGAKLVESAEDVLEELRPGLVRRDAPALPQRTHDDPVLEALGYDPVSLDALLARTGMDTATLQARLLELELDGEVGRLPGGLFQRMASA